MTKSLNEAKRVKAFRNDLIAVVPRFPNDRASLHAIKGKSLTGLLVAYIGWRLRYIGVRPRIVRGYLDVLHDTRAAALKPHLDAFLEAVEVGRDLTPYLSLQPHSRGYAPASDAKKSGANTWVDKDFLLNVMGFHHFHLGLTTEAAGHISRMNEVLFAAVTRDEFEIICLTDYTAFKQGADDTLTPERQRLWAVHEERRAYGLLPGQMSLSGYGGLGITTSGHPTAVSLRAQRHARIIREIDPKLNDPAFVQTLYQAAPVPLTSTLMPKLRWMYQHLDFGLLDEKTSTFFIIEYGSN